MAPTSWSAADTPDLLAPDELPLPDAAAACPEPAEPEERDPALGPPAEGAELPAEGPLPVEPDPAAAALDAGPADASLVPTGWLDPPEPVPAPTVPRPDAPEPDEPPAPDDNDAAPTTGWAALRIESCDKRVPQELATIMTADPTATVRQRHPESLTVRFMFPHPV